MIITMRHVRQAKICSRGARQLAERQGLDWSRFLKVGVPSEELEQIDDAMVKRLLEVAHGK